MLTSTVAFRLENLCAQVQRALPVRTTSRPCRNEIVFLTVRVHNNRTLYWNLAAIRIVGFEEKNKNTKKKPVVSLATFVALQVWYGIPNERVPKSPLNSG